MLLSGPWAPGPEPWGPSPGPRPQAPGPGPWAPGHSPDLVALGPVPRALITSFVTLQDEGSIYCPTLIYIYIYIILSRWFGFPDWFSQIWKLSWRMPCCTDGQSGGRTVGRADSPSFGRTSLERAQDCRECVICADCPGMKYSDKS